MLTCERRFYIFLFQISIESHEAHVGAERSEGRSSSLGAATQRGEAGEESARRKGDFLFKCDLSRVFDTCVNEVHTGLAPMCMYWCMLFSVFCID